MGWAGDAQAFIGTAAYNMDVAAFFTAWLRTYEDNQYSDGGFPNFAPVGGGTSPGWSDAGIVCPWTIYRVYGDRRILEEHYPAMVRWIECMEKHSKDCLRRMTGSATGSTSARRCPRTSSPPPISPTARA